MTLTSMVKFGSKLKLTEANLIFTMQELVKPHGHAQKKKKVNKILNKVWEILSIFCGLLRKP